MDGAHTHGHGPTGLGELLLLAIGVVLAAEILAHALTFLLIGLAVAGGLLLIGLAAYVVGACRRYQQADRMDAAQYPGQRCLMARCKRSTPIRCRCGRRSPNSRHSCWPPAPVCPPPMGRGISICTSTASPPSRPPRSSLACKPSSAPLAGRTEGASD